MRLIGLLVLSIFLIGCAANSDSEATTETEENEVEATEGNNTGDVVTMQDKTFDEEDLAFYKLMNEVSIMLQINEVEDDDKIAYLEEQLAYYENVNVNLQSMIELYAMSLLAEEKNYFVPDDNLQDAVKDFNEKIANSDDATDAIEVFGDVNYNRNIEEYIRQTTLRDRIAGELKEEIKDDNPDAIDNEINYLLEDEFEELYMGQLATLDMEIHLQ